MEFKLTNTDFIEEQIKELQDELAALGISLKVTSINDKKISYTVAPSHNPSQYAEFYHEQINTVVCFYCEECASYSYSKISLLKPLTDGYRSREEAMGKELSSKVYAMAVKINGQYKDITDNAKNEAVKFDTCPNCGRPIR